MSKFFSRKFLFALAIFIIATVAMWFEKISGTEWVAAISFVGSMYFFANAYQAKGSMVTVVDEQKKLVGFDVDEYRQREGQDE